MALPEVLHPIRKESSQPATTVMNSPPVVIIQEPLAVDDLQRHFDSDSILNLNTSRNLDQYMVDNTASVEQSKTLSKVCMTNLIFLVTR